MDRIQISKPKFTVRRLTRGDTAAIKAMYALLGADGAWVLRESVQNLFVKGEIWGLFYGITLRACCVIADAAAPICMVRMTVSTNLISTNSAILLPCAGNFEGLPVTRFLHALALRLERRGDGEQCTALLPVRTGGKLIASYFEAGYHLCGIRPLDHLRPHYIFRAKSVKKYVQPCIIVPISDTFTLSQRLAHGYFGTELQTKEGVDFVVLQQEEL